MGREVWRVEPRKEVALCDWGSRVGGCVGQFEVDIELREGGLARNLNLVDADELGGGCQSVPQRCRSQIRAGAGISDHASLAELAY